MAVTFHKGAASHAAVQEAEAKAQAAQDPNTYAYTSRFWVPQDGSGKVTFLDGDLDEDGLLDELTYWEHQLKMNGHWRNWFPCIQGDENCPICEAGEKNSLVAIFTIIDHGEWKSKKTGKTYKDQKKLFVCKKDGLKRLRKLAGNHGGLRGVTFDISRIGSKSENTGDTFDFIKKWDDMGDFATAYSLVEEATQPFDYTVIVPDNDRSDLAKLGFGSGSAAPAVGAEAAPEEDYEGVL